jgi:hypothetical protein
LVECAGPTPLCQHIDAALADTWIASAQRIINAVG